MKNQSLESVKNDFLDTCSWKGQMEKTRSCEILSWKVSVQVGKSLSKLARTERSWKEPIEVGKNRAKLKRTERSSKASFEVGKFR